MSLIIDAYNVLHCTHVLPERWSGVSAAGLCQMIAQAGVRQGRAVVVCDGTPPGDQMLAMADARAAYGELRYDFEGVELLYAGGGRDADSVIEALIESEPAPRELVVVSNDKRVQRAGRQAGAKVVGSEEFLRKLAAALRDGQKPAGHGKPTGADAELWMKKFGIEEEKVEAGEAEAAEGLDRETEHWLREFGFEPEEEN